MKHFINLLKKAIKSVVIITILIAVLWGTLYHLTDFDTVVRYLGIGAAVCAINTVIYNFRQHKITSLFYVKGLWVIMAGVVLVLYYAGFEAASVFVAAAILASPFFGATISEGLVGLTLLITLAHILP